MRSFFKINLLLVVFFCPFFSKGQNISDRLVKDYYPNSYWLTLRYDQYLKSGSFFFFENNERFSNTLNTVSVTRLYFLAGYEHKASERWYLGFSEKFVLIPASKFNTKSYSNLYTRANISHRGHIGKLRFIKEFAFEHLYDLTKTDNPYVIIENKGRASFSPSLVKEVLLKGKSLYFIFNYRAYMLFDFNNDQRSAYSKRLIDKTRLRFEIDYKVSERVLLSVFAMRDTEYSYRQNANDEARVNRITPTFGFGVNFLTNAPKDFLPGFPIK